MPPAVCAIALDDSAELTLLTAAVATLDVIASPEVRAQLKPTVTTEMVDAGTEQFVGAVLQSLGPEILPLGSVPGS